ncbi:MAG: OmpA family protein [Calditrichaceae bacterium]|nr:OmpA family protein [Calditrichaceae bacterium]MBN2708283.1 OmpA family protein [Calditrichaceae bacterium]RQV91925.1 MAG: OmpA family protein [Calditrichota bacterium]
MKKQMFLATMFVFCALCFAQEDFKGSKDHPLFNRMPDYWIMRYEEKDFNVFKDFRDASGKKISVEGKYYYFNYGIKKGSKTSSGPAVLRNYMNAVKQVGGEVILEEGCCNVYLKLNRNNRVTWIRVMSYTDAKNYQVWIVEEAEMKQDIIVNANAMLSDINDQGRVALYGIYFDFNKSEIKPESEPTLKEISTLLSKNPKLTLYVVGHTDNVGDFSYNTKLSQSRAEAVVNRLVSKYSVDKNRLTAAGVGPLSPVTTNDTEEGKARNRRVELIKK